MSSTWLEGKRAMSLLALSTTCVDSELCLLSEPQLPDLQNMGINYTSNVIRETSHRACL